MNGSNTTGSQHQKNGSANHNEKEELIEIDVDLLSQPKAKRVKTLYIDERFMKTSMVPKRTNRELRQFFSGIQPLDSNMERMHVQLETTPLTGALLALAVTPHLTALHVQSGLLLANTDDRQALGRVVYEHEFLAEITLHNLMVRDGLLARWRKYPPPPLDILVPAFTSIVFLNVLELSCSPQMEVPPPVPAATTVTVPPFTPRPMLSLLGVKELFQSLTLQRLELTRLGLTDDHFGILVEQISQNSPTSCLNELIVNENQNTDTGLDMLSSLLFKKDCALERLECYQSDSVVVNTTIELLQEALQENTTLKTLRLHLWGDEEDDNVGAKKTRIPFFTQLNQKGRKRLIDKTATLDRWLDLIVNVKDDPSQLFYCLRNSRYWWKCRGIIHSRPKDFVMPTKQKSLSPPQSPQSDSRPEGSNSAMEKKKKNLAGSRLSQLKNRHSELLDGLNLNLNLGDDLSDDDGEGPPSNMAMEAMEHGKKKRQSTDDSDQSITEHLKAENLPQFLTLGGDDDENENDDMHNSRMSAISMGAESYVQDLMHQKEKRPIDAREEVLEEALEELDYTTSHNKLPPGMSEELFFHNVLKRLIRQKEKEEKKRERKLDSLLEQALVKEVEKENAAKEGKAQKTSDAKGNKPGKENGKKKKLRAEQKSNSEQEPQAEEG